MSKLPDGKFAAADIGLTHKQVHEARVIRDAERADIIEIGRDLILVKDTLKHGEFLPWIEVEFGMSEWTARRFMSAAETFKSGFVPDLPPKVLYALAAPSTPEEVRSNVVQMAERGEKVTAQTVADLKRKVKEAEAATKAERTKAPGDPCGSPAFRCSVEGGA